MLREREISIYDYRGFSEPINTYSPSLNGHYWKLAFIASKITQEMDVLVEDTQDVLMASMLHDIGAYSPGYNSISQKNYFLEQGEKNEN